MSDVGASFKQRFVKSQDAAVRENLHGATIYRTRSPVTRLTAIPQVTAPSTIADACRLPLHEQTFRP